VAGSRGGGPLGSIVGNFIGTDVTGTADLGNGGAGIRVTGMGEIDIGGAASGQRNVISGNEESGIAIGGPENIARAVNVSSAFPGAFHRIPLENFSPDRPPSEAKYRHLYDGGPTDNLGISTLIQVLLQEVCGSKSTTSQYTQQALRKKLVEKTESSCNNQTNPIPVDTLFPQGCLIISLDATPREDDEDGHRAHGRSVADYFIDSNFLNATDVMLLSIRREVLENVGLSRPRQDKVRFSKFSFDNGQSHCHFWHVALRHFQEDDRAARIGTSFGLETWEQDLLTTAGAAIVREGLGARDIPEILSRMAKTP
jgi:predicted acylesterase/phospholipase RssA